MLYLDSSVPWRVDGGMVTGLLAAARIRDERSQPRATVDDQAPESLSERVARPIEIQPTPQMV